MCPSGGTYILLEYATRLKERGHLVRCYYNVSPVCYPKIYGWKDMIKDSYIGRLYRRERGKYLGNQQIPELEKRYPDAKIEMVEGMEDARIKAADVGIATSWPAAYMLHQTKKTHIKCYLVQDYEDWDRHGRGKNSYYLPLDKIVISNQLNSVLKEKLNIGPFPVVHDGIDLNLYMPLNKKPSNDSVTCAMLYSHRKLKGCSIGVKAFLQLKKEMPNLKLILFGVPEKPKLGFEFEYYRNATVKEVVDIYQRSDIFIWPTIFEGWGLTPCEAMACKCAVVGSNVASMREIGKTGYDCLLSAPGDSEGLYKNLKAAASDTEMRENLCNNALETIKQLSWDKSVSDLEKYLKKFAGENSKVDLRKK